MVTDYCLRWIAILTYGSSHKPVSLRMPQANREAEHSVETFKSMLRNTDPWISLMIYCTVAMTGASPAQLMFNCHMRTNLPALIAVVFYRICVRG